MSGKAIDVISNSCFVKLIVCLLYKVFISLAKASSETDLSSSKSVSHLFLSNWNDRFELKNIDNEQLDVIHKGAICRAKKARRHSLRYSKLHTYNLIEQERQVLRSPFMCVSLRKQQTVYAETLSVLCGVLFRARLPLTFFVLPLEKRHLTFKT